MLSLLLGCPLEKEKRKESVCACLHRAGLGSGPSVTPGRWAGEHRGCQHWDSLLQVLLKCREQQQLVMTW